MATIKLDNIAATASITLQLIKDYSMYSSEIISSNGNIFQSTDESTVLTLRIYKGVEEITNRVTDIEWHRYFLKNDTLEEDTNWGINKKNKNKITLYKSEVEEKSIIQANGYSIIDGKRELVTTARITIIKISDIYISDIAPTNPSDKMMWMDTNMVPPTLKIWNKDLDYWIVSGMEVPVIKNLIRNSNFWADITDYFDIVESSEILTPVRISYQNKQWAQLESRAANSSGGGIAQTIGYPIAKKSNYIFSFIAYRDSRASYIGKTIHVKIESINSSNTVKTLVNNNYNLNTTITTVSVPFISENDTEQIRVYIGTRNRSRCLFYVTELSLYNSSVYYPWELCPDDIGKQINNKLENNRLSVFNTLTDNGSMRAIYESEGQYYIRSEYIIPKVAMQEDFEDLKSKNNSLQSLTQSLLQRVQNLESDYNTLQNNYNTLRNNYNTLQNNYNTLRNEMNDLIMRIWALENKQ